MPFRYGIANVTGLPHVFVTVAASVGGRATRGIAADHLPPKWFTKNPDTAPDADIAEMRRVVEHACALAEGLEGASVFDVWRTLYDAQAAWGAAENLAPLLTGFGTSLVERALLDAFCRVTGQPFARMLHENAFGIRLGDLHPELGERAPADFLPATPAPSILARHTVGLSDPLTEGEIAPGDRLDDGLPQSLAACIQAYGLRHFKVKIGGDPAGDVARLQAVLNVLAAHAPPDFALSLDGNEGYRAPKAFGDFWARADKELGLLFTSRLLFVEQPLHRDVALSDAVGRASAAWPPTIIDESDAEISSLPRALFLGYAGTSHKNCKGIFKGIAGACLLAHRRQTRPQTVALLSGEDLSTVGPVSLQQDLAAQAALGVTSVERNGHHYFAGLSGFPALVGERTRATHPDLFHENPQDGWPTLTIADGKIVLQSVNAAPFGCGLAPDDWPLAFTND